MNYMETPLNEIKIIISEVDGVITNGLNPVDELGNIPFKNFCHKDFEAINELKKTFKFVFLSSDNKVSFNFMRNKNIPFYWAQKSKKDIFSEIMYRYGVTPDNILYIGSSISDLYCINLSKISVCPKDAPNIVKNNVDFVFESGGGCGIITDLYELLISEISKRKVE